jgi:hypothetical protein
LIFLEPTFQMQLAGTLFKDFPILIVFAYRLASVPAIHHRVNLYLGRRLVSIVRPEPQQFRKVGYVATFRLRRSICLSVELRGTGGRGAGTFTRRHFSRGPQRLLFDPAKWQRAASRKHGPRIRFSRCRTTVPSATAPPTLNPSRGSVP